MVRDLPPEERLLRLIKGASEKKPDIISEKAAEEKSVKPQTAEAKKPEPKQAVTPMNLSGGGNKPDMFKIAVFLLIGLFVIGVIYFAYDILAQKQSPPIIDIEELVPPEPAAPQQELSQEPEPAAEDFLEDMPEDMPEDIRQLFGAPVTREMPDIIEQGPPISELARNLTLVGVITGDDSQAIIQDKGTQQTFYVYEQEKVLEFTVKKIEKAMVVLEYNGETFKLSL